MTNGGTWQIQLITSLHFTVMIPKKPYVKCTENSPRVPHLHEHQVSCAGHRSLVCFRAAHFTVMIFSKTKLFQGKNLSSCEPDAHDSALHYRGDAKARPQRLHGVRPICAGGFAEMPPPFPKMISAIMLIAFVI
jgi:hypothetical protein